MTRRAFVGANSVVTRPIPDYAIAAGSPAKVLRYRDRPQGEPGRPGVPASRNG